MPLIPANAKFLSQPVYNVGDYGKDVFIPFVLADDGTTAYAMQTFTIDAAATAIKQVPDINGSVNSQPIDDNDNALVGNNTLGIIFPANNTAFSQVFTWTPDMNALVYKVSLQIAVGLNVSSYGAGNFNIGRLNVSAVERASNRQLIPILRFNAGTSIFTNLTAAGTHVMIVMADYTTPFKVYSRSPIDITISLTTVNATTTWQEGILPVFCWNKLNVLKTFSQSGVKFHVHATLDHLDPVYKADPDRLGVIQ